MQVTAIWKAGPKWEPDRSRGKRFRTRPRSARGKWELVVDGRKKKATVAPKLRKNPISLERLRKIKRLIEAERKG